AFYRFLNANVTTGLNCYLTALTYLKDVSALSLKYFNKDDVQTLTTKMALRLKRARKTVLQPKLLKSEVLKNKRYLSEYKTRSTINTTTSVADSEEEERHVREWLSAHVQDSSLPVTEREWNRATKFLALNMLTSTYQRPGAVANLTQEELFPEGEGRAEFLDDDIPMAECDMSDNNDVVVGSSEHKTKNTHGPAPLVRKKKLEDMFEMYLVLQKRRNPTATTGFSTFRNKSVRKSEFLFERVNSNRKKFKITSSILRRAAATQVCATGSEEQKLQLAAVMTHTPGVQTRKYDQGKRVRGMLTAKGVQAIVNDPKPMSRKRSD
ncbi:AP-1-like transcription factor yap1, partial [Frankliniella fusca]